MIGDDFYRTLRAHGIRFFTGVPDSSLSGFCSAVSSDHSAPVKHLVAASEGAAVALAAGFYLATGEVSAVYAQNSGLANALNPYLSLCHEQVYAIPILFVIGWRGEPEKKDEPQHRKTGASTIDLLRLMNLDVFHLASAEGNWKEKLSHFLAATVRCGHSAAILVSKGLMDHVENARVSSSLISRREALEVLLSNAADDIIYAGIGHTGREVLALRSNSGNLTAAHGGDFLCVGAMGYASQLAIGSVVGGTGKTVWCFDGDGSFLMHMGATTIVRKIDQTPFVHVLLDNGVHASVGGQPVCGAPHDYASIAKAIGYGCVQTARTVSEVEETARIARSFRGPSFLWIPINPATNTELPRPSGSFIERKRTFMARFQHA